MTAAPLVLMLALSAPGLGAAPATSATHRWPDGLTLVVQPTPSATSISLRLVVRAGGFLDPVGKAGLAHMVEHVLVQSAPGLELSRDVRAARGTMNAFTSGGWTMFVLDAPADRFAGLAERYLRLVTSPDFALGSLPRERALVGQEASFRGVSAEVSLVDLALFPAPVQGGPLIGTEESRGDVHLEDVRQFFLDHYLPPLTTVVLTGAVTLEAGIGLVERGYLVPPVEAPPARAPEPLSLPVNQHVPSWVTVVAQGYVMDPVDRELCRTLAALVELRLALAVREAGPRVPQVGAVCQRLRGRDLLIAFAYTSTFDAPDLPERVDAVFLSLGQAPPTLEERALVDRRLVRQQERVRADPVAFADLLALHAAEFGPDALETVLPAGLVPSPRRLQQAVARSVVRERRFQLDFSPRD